MQRRGMLDVDRVVFIISIIVKGIISPALS
jgi:hypothetical protein